MSRTTLTTLCFLTTLLAAGCKQQAPGTGEKHQALRPITLLNVSYDPTREFYQAFNRLFAQQWQAQHNQRVNLRMSHGGSGKQARAVIDGLEADVVTLALAFDIDALRVHRQLIPDGWIERLPHNSAPYTSTMVFLVRQGNPKNIRDWNDLAQAGVSVITPNPKTSGAARWTYLAAYAYALRQPGGNDASAAAFVKQVYLNVPVLDSGARGSSTTFAQNNIGDVLITWENEAYLLLKEMGRERFAIVMPASMSILAEPSIALVDANVDKHGTRKAAEAYLNLLYSEEGQELAAQHFYRPRNAEVLARHRALFAEIELLTIDEVFGGWDEAQKIHFDDGGVFDRIYQR